MGVVGYESLGRISDNHDEFDRTVESMYSRGPHVLLKVVRSFLYGDLSRYGRRHPPLVPLKALSVNRGRTISNV